MIIISDVKFTSLTEIITRWETNTDAVSSSVKSIRDKLLPLLASLRGICTTPSALAAVSPDVTHLPGELEESLITETEAIADDVDVDDVFEDDGIPEDGPPFDGPPDEDFVPGEGDPPPGYDTWEDWFMDNDGSYETVLDP